MCRGLVAGAAVTGPEPARGPLPGVRAVMDGLSDAMVIADMGGVVRYANPAAERLLGWERGALAGVPATELVPESLGHDMAPDFEAFVATSSIRLAGRQVPVSLRRRDGAEIVVEVGLSLVDHPLVGRVAIAVIRSRSDRRLHRWSQITRELLDALSTAPAGEPPSERLLSTLGRRLHWDVATLWGLTPSGNLVCHHVWTSEPDVAPAFVEEKAKDPTRGVGGLPGWVFHHEEPLWVPDLSGDERFTTEAARRDGLQSAYAFPVRYHGACVGVVKMLSRRWREPDPGLVELTEAVSEHLGDMLHALTQAAEREELVEELREVRRSQEFLLQASRVLSEASDYRETVERLAQVAVPVLADLCLIDVREEDGEVRRVAARHADPAKRALTEELRLHYAPAPGSAHPSVAVMETGVSRWDPVMTDEFLAATSNDEHHLSIMKALGFTSYMTVPLVVSDRVLGTVTLVSAGSGRRFVESDLVFAEELARQVQSVVERARAYDRQQRISHVLQRSLLPDRFPQIEGWSFGARYLPAAEGVEIGGDWFDVIRLADGSVALAVGDVEGHDMEAAKFMGRLRHVLWLLVLEERSPGATLARLNRFLLSTGADRIATVLVALLDVESGALRAASAGHPAALVIDRSTSVTELPVVPGPPLGVPDARYREHLTTLAGECLLMFTDGLVERRDAGFDEGIEQLRRVIASAPSCEPELLVDHVLTGMLPKGTGADDVAVLAVQRIRP